MDVQQCLLMWLLFIVGVHGALIVDPSSSTEAVDNAPFVSCTIFCRPLSLFVVAGHLFKEVVINAITP